MGTTLGKVASTGVCTGKTRDAVGYLLQDSARPKNASGRVPRADFAAVTKAERNVDGHVIEAGAGFLGLEPLTYRSEGVELPGAGLSGEELTVTVIPQKKDEFTCASCFLVRHRSQIAREKNGLAYCRDCEG